MNEPVPVIAIDGPSASGKGTVAALVARRLGFHHLDSGSLYRLVALDAAMRGVALEDAPALAGLAAALDVRFADGNVFLADRDVTDAIRTEACSVGASAVAVHAAVRNALFERQHAFRREPGLVAEGRDMGTVVFPDAGVKVFLTACAEVRAERRYKQLIDKGLHANLSTLLQDLRERDARDAGRSSAPLRKSDDAILLDTSSLGVDESVRVVLDEVKRRLPLLAAAVGLP